MQRRKDNKGRVLKDGEVYRKSDGLYMYRWTAKNGKRHTIYDATLEGLREKEEKIQHDLADGLRIPECSLTLNDLFELWRKNKVGLKEHTFANYVYMYNRFVRDEIGMMKLKDIRKSDIRSYYNGIVRNGKMALNTLETIQNVLHQVFAVAVDDEYIRVNPTDGVLTAIKAAHQYETPKRHALTLPQQQAFLNFIKKTPKFQHWLPMFTFMLGTGCRISETVGLCWGDIDFESGYMLAQNGYRPILLERGKDVEARKKDVEAFWNGGPLNPESNVSFGEGGAGTFSDGKLNTLIKDKDGRGRHVLSIFVENGAQPEILYEAKPHIGTLSVRSRNG